VEIAVVALCTLFLVVTSQTSTHFAHLFRINKMKKVYRNNLKVYFAMLFVMTRCANAYKRMSWLNEVWHGFWPSTWS
jgi:hypothetical protein